VYKVEKSPKKIHKLKSTQTPNSQKPENIPTHPNRKANKRKYENNKGEQEDWPRRFDGVAQPDKGKGGANQSTPQIRFDNPSRLSLLNDRRVPTRKKQLIHKREEEKGGK
jgi:hypothetical protein